MKLDGTLTISLVVGLATPFWKTKPRPVDVPTGVGVAVEDVFGVREEFLLVMDGVLFKKEPRVRLMQENLVPT